MKSQSNLSSDFVLPVTNLIVFYLIFAIIKIAKTVSYIVHLRSDFLRDFLGTKVLETFVLISWAYLFCDSVMYSIYDFFLLQIYERLQKSHKSEPLKINMELFIGPLLSS